MAASQAEAALHAFGHKPVAGVLPRVHAQRPPRAAACCAQPGAFFFQSSQSLSFRDIAQSLAALPADTVLEVENVAASLAGKEFHVGRAILRRYRPAGALAGPSLRRQALPIERMVGFWVICSFCPWSGPYRGDAAGPVGSCLPSLSALNSRRLWRSARIARQRPCGR